MIHQKPVALLIGILTAIPCIYMFAFLAYIFMLYNHPPTDQQLSLLFAAHISVMLLSLGLILFYFWHLYQNNFVSGNQKMLWVIAFFMGSSIAMLPYWYQYIWSKTQ